MFINILTLTLEIFSEMKAVKKIIILGFGFLRGPLNNLPPGLQGPMPTLEDIFIKYMYDNYNYFYKNCKYLLRFCHLSQFFFLVLLYIFSYI